MVSAPSPKFWGILNITPDSFSDGDATAFTRDGKPNTKIFLQRAQKIIAEGAAILDIGAESTRPNAQAITAEEEWKRLKPVLQELIPTCSIPISIDTYKTEIAELALSMGVAIINDVRGLQGDPKMAHVIARHNAAAVIMHWEKQTRQESLLLAIEKFWRHSLELAQSAGIPEEKIFLDPGIGFDKSDEDNWEIIRNLDYLQKKFAPIPILLGVSRKRFIQHFSQSTNRELWDLGSCAIANEALAQGVFHFRVHNVALHRTLLHHE